MIYYHKNPNIETTVEIIKLQYRDEKRIKFKGILRDRNGMIIETGSYKVTPDFFTRFSTKKPDLVPDHEDLINLDNEKEDYGIT